jgi:hypothetical protein
MQRLRLVLAASLACCLALVLCAPAGAADATFADYDDLQVGAADSGEIAVVWRATEGPRMTVQAAIGTPGAPFSAPVTLGASSASATPPAVAMDAAGDVVVVWEPLQIEGCVRTVCATDDSLGVFAAIRPAGGSFQDPVRLLPGQHSVHAEPMLRMNRRGDWIVVMHEGDTRVVSFGRGATPPTSPATQIPAPGFDVRDAAVDDAGNATFAGADLEHPATIVRAADGAFGPLTVLDDATIYSFGITLGTGPAGHAVAVWPAAGYLRSATRLPGGSFGAPVSSGVAAEGAAPQAIGVDGLGRTITILSPPSVSPASMALQARRGTVSAPFGEPATISAPGQDATGPRLAMASDGNAIVSWDEIDHPYQWPGALVEKVAIATDAGPLSPPLTLAHGPSSIALPAVAIDGTGRGVVIWTRPAVDGERLLAAALTATAVAGPTVVAQAPSYTLQPPHSLPIAKQVLSIRTDGTIRPLLACVAPDGGSCIGTLQIDARVAGAAKRIHVGAAHFARAASLRRVTVHVSRAARRAAAHRSLRVRIVVSTTRPTGGSSRSVASMTLRKRS